MPEWWTYSPSDFLMFSSRTYYRLFEIGNRRLWPFQFLALLAGLAVVLMLRRTSPRMHRVAVALLACGWLVCGWTYFLQAYATIHTFGRWFAAAFIAQGIGLVVWSVIGPHIVIASRSIERVGMAILFLAVFGQPLVCLVVDRPWTQIELFGLTPDPTATATMGALLALADAGWWFWLMPVGWSLFSGITLHTLGSPDAFVVPSMALVAMTLGVIRARLTARRDV